MSDKKNVPKIRFPGFTEPWEQRKLGEIATYRNGKAHEANQLDVGTYELVNLNSISIDGGLKPSGKFIEDGSDTLQRNDLVMVLSDVGHGDLLGRVAIIPENNRYVLNQRVALLRINDDTNTYFLFSIINRYQDYFKKLGAGSSQLNISRGIVENFEVAYPNVAEQRMIADYFQSLDHLITLHQRKLEHVKKMKKSMLQKMFPKKNQLYPEVRFPGFTDAWEQRKFSECTWNAGKRNKEDLDLEPYAITNEHGFIKQSEAHDDFGYMKDTDRKAYNIVMPNSFAYNPARINVGSIGYYEGTENVIVSSLYEVFQTADYVDDRFLWHWFKSDEFPKWIERLQEGSVRLYFYYDKLCECQMLMPSVPEQKKIAEALDNLDNLITLHQRKQNGRNLK